jgi:hypothetical protein
LIGAGVGLIGTGVGGRIGEGVGLGLDQVPAETRCADIFPTKPTSASWIIFESFVMVQV